MNDKVYSCDKADLCLARCLELPDARRREPFTGSPTWLKLSNSGHN